MTKDVSDATPGPAPGEGAHEESVPTPDATPAPEAGASEAAVQGRPEAEAGGGRPEADIYKDKWLRSEAEMQNFRRRAAREREEAVGRSQDFVLLDVIGVLDDLDRALASLTPEHAAEAWVQGVTLTAQRMRDALARWDVLEIEALGEPFDPNVHEAMLEIDAPPGIDPGAVAQVIQKGYRRGEKTLRAARVVVARSQDGA